MQNQELVKFSNFVVNTIENIKEIPKNPCCIFDIDDTLIDTSNNLIDPIFGIYNYCILMGYYIIIITCRPAGDRNIRATIEQIKSHGINIVDRLYFMEIKDSNPYEYKESCRLDVKNKGLNAIMSIGDMPWDVGKYGGIGFIIPKTH